VLRSGRVVLLACIAGLNVVPLLLMFKLSFGSQLEIISPNGAAGWLTQTLTAENYQAAIARIQDQGRLIGSLVTPLGVALASLSLALSFGRHIGNAGNRARATIASSALLARVIPPAAICLPLLRLFEPVRSLPPAVVAGLIYVGLLLPIAVWLCMPFFRLSRQREGASLVSGLEPERHVALVAARDHWSYLLGVLLLIALMVWNETFIASLLGHRTIAEMVPSLITHRGTQWGLLMAVASLLSIPAVVTWIIVTSVLTLTLRGAKHVA